MRRGILRHIGEDCRKDTRVVRDSQNDEHAQRYAEGNYFARADAVLSRAPVNAGERSRDEADKKKNEKQRVLSEEPIKEKCEEDEADRYADAERPASANKGLEVFFRMREEFGEFLEDTEYDREGRAGYSGENRPRADEKSLHELKERMRHHALFSVVVRAKPAREEPYALDDRFVLFAADASGERIGRVAGKDRHLFLDENRPVSQPESTR